MPWRQCEGSRAPVAYDRCVAPLVLLAFGIALLIAAGLVLRSFGPRLRVGRLLATTPRVTVAEARALAEAGTRRYVRVDGRIDSDQEFEDRDHRPLVLRRTRIEARDRGGWRSLEDGRELVQFEIHEGIDAIGIDAQRLDAGLVVVPRESAGTAAELGERASGVPPTTPVRVVIEQLSSVEHATALGMPISDAGSVRLTAGLGRPLVVTTLERDEAIRVLAKGRTWAPRAALGLIAVGAACAIIGVLMLALRAVA